MRFGFLFACVLVVSLAGCQSVPQLATVYACAPGEEDLSRLAIHPNGRFVINLAFRDKEGARRSAGIFSGTYREGVLHYDLKFESLIRSQIEAMFRGTMGGTFVGSGSTYRLMKRAPRLMIDGCVMERLP